jgi:hypothetical protein
MSSAIHFRKWYADDPTSPFAKGLSSSTGGFYIFITMGQSNRRYSIDYAGKIFTSWYDYTNKVWLDWESIQGVKDNRIVDQIESIIWDNTNGGITIKLTSGGRYNIKNGTWLT